MGMGLLELLGKPIGGRDVQAFVERAGEPPDVSCVEDTRFLGLKALGICLSVEAPDVRVSTIHVYCEPADDYAAFLGRLPLGLDSSFDRACVRSLLGPPAASGAAQELEILGRKGAWDRYDFEEYSVHVEYTLSGARLALLTLMLAGRVPGKLRDS